MHMIIGNIRHFDGSHCKRSAEEIALVTESWRVDILEVIQVAQKPNQWLQTRPRGAEAERHVWRVHVLPD